MFDILVYVFENYLPGACPEPGTLARKLSAAGFDEDEIAQALHWLAGLEQAEEEVAFNMPPQSGSQRFFSEEEMTRLSSECRGFLSFLEQAEAIDPITREMILERAMAVESRDTAAVSLARFKVIILMVMWRRQLPFENLVFEGLLEDEDEDSHPLMH